MVKCGWKNKKEKQKHFSLQLTLSYLIIKSITYMADIYKPLQRTSSHPDMGHHQMLWVMPGICSVSSSDTLPQLFATVSTEIGETEK